MTEKKKPNHLSECLSAIFNKKPCDYKPKEVSPYILTLFVSEHKDLIEYASNINQFQYTLPPELIMKYYTKTVPKAPRSFKFTKKTDESKARDKDIVELMQTYNISKLEASKSIVQ